MLPRSWCCISLFLLGFLAACQPIRPIDATPAPISSPAAGVPSTTTSGQIDCPLITEPPLDLIIAPTWQEGESRQYQASYRLTRIHNGKAQPTITTAYTMSITVLKANEDGFIMEWRYIAMLPGPRKIRLEYSVTPFGEYIELRNLDELQSLIEPLSAQKNVLINDPQEVAALIASDLQTYHAIYGLYFTETPHHLMTQSAMLPSGHTPGKNTIRISLARYGASSGCLHLSVASKWQANADQDEDFYTVESKAQFDVDLNTGWPKSVQIERTNIMEGSGQIEQLNLTSVPPVE